MPSALFSGSLGHSIWNGIKLDNVLQQMYDGLQFFSLPLSTEDRYLNVSVVQLS